MTATQSALIEGTMFYANIETFQQYDPSQLLLVTYHYPAVTLSTIKPSDTIVFVNSRVEWDKG